MVFINTCKIVVFVGKQNGLATIARGISRYLSYIYTYNINKINQ